jgi:hypothetical protein
VGLAALSGCHSPSSPSGSTGSGSSSLSITATWDAAADIDLHVIEPSGVEISWLNPGPTDSGGVLDGDAEQDCKPTGAGNKEVVHWSSAPNGTYVVRLDYYDSCGAPAANYTVTIADNRTTLPPITGTFSGIGDHGNAPGVTVKTFTHVGSSFSAFRLPDNLRSLLLANVAWAAFAAR